MLYRECFAACSGHFQLLARETSTLSTRGNEVLRYPPAARRAPAVAVGFWCAMGLKKLFLTNIEYQWPKLEIERSGMKVYQFAMVTDWQNAPAALLAVLRHAVIAMRGIELNASSEGNMI